ncbi:MAG: hypothetical protein M1832_002335 [Thelocarpon impressellum]|nr:MAG: hypothetical protein M1832_002335 [Thelocarpon impressellum]
MQRRLRKESPPEADAAAPQKASAESIQPTFDEAARGLLDERGNPPPAVSQLGASLFESAVTAEHGGLPRSPLLSPHGGSLLSPLDTPQESPLQTPLTSDGFPPFAPTPVHTESDEEDHYAERYLSASGKAVRREKRPAIPNRNLRRGRVVLAEPTPPLVQDNVRRNKRRSVSTSGRLQGLRSLTDLRADFARLASDDLGSSHKVVDSKDFMYYAARLDRPRLSEETQTPTSQASPFLPFSNQSRPSKDAYRITPPSLEVGNTKQRLASSESQTSSIGRWKIIARRSDKAKAKAKAERKERGRAETGEEKRNSDGTKRLVMNYDELVLLERFNAAGYPSRGDAKKTLSADGPAGLPRGRHEGYESFRVPSRGYPPSSAGSSVRPSGEITSPLGSPPICRSLDPTFLRNASCSLDEPRAGASPSKSRSCPAKGALSSLSTSVSASKLGSDPKEAAPGPAPRKKKSRFKRIFSKEGSAAGPQTRSAELQVLEAQDNELLEVRLDERHLNVIVLVLQTSADEVSVQAGSIRGLLGEVLAPVFTSRTYEQMIAYDTLIAQSIFFLADRLDLLGFMAERFKEAEALEAPGLQLKILTLLNVWLECKPEDVVEWDDEPLNLVLNSARNKRGVVADTCRQLGRKVSAVRVQDSKHEAMLQKTSKAITWKGEVHAAISFLENFAPETTELDCVEVNLLAKYLAAVDLVFFREATQPKQLELKLKQLHGGGTPTHLTNLDHRQMIQRAGRLAMRAEMIKHWTLCSVFNTRSPERRGHVASQFVFVAHRLITYGDLEGASVIVNALRSDCFTRQDFPVTWWHMERLGSAGVLDNVSAMLTDSYKRTLTNLADPVTPIFTGKQGLFAKMLEEHSSMPHFIRTALNTLEGQEARCVPAETALKYAWEPRMLASGPLLDLSKYERMWQLHAAARARVKVAHPYGTVTRDAYVMQLYEPGRFCWGTEEGFCPTKPTPNKQLDALSELVERSILRRWTMMAPGALSLEDSRPMVLQALRARGVEGERRYGY